MKVVVGADLSGAFTPALQLLKGLEFPDVQVHFVNAVEPILPDGSYPELAAAHPIAMIYDDLQKAGHALLDRAVGDWPGASSQVEMGNAATALLDTADAHNADLLAVGSREKSLIESFFAGSVTKLLATASKRPVLVGKHAPHFADSLTVVIADDLSEYSTKAIDTFIGWHPKGVKKAVILTADVNDQVFEGIHPEGDSDPGKVRWTIQQRHEHLVSELSAMGIQVETVISEDAVKPAIHKAMAESNADLLVMGAHGHGFIERLVLGSIALHEVVREPHNVLLMRA